MAIIVTCEHCKETLKVADTMAGKRGKCPKCKGKISVPDIPPGSTALVRTKRPPTPAAADPTWEQPPQPEESVPFPGQSVRCLTCGNELINDAEVAGQVVECPHCLGRLQMPPLGGQHSLPIPFHAPTLVAPIGEMDVASIPVAETTCPMCGETIKATAKRCKHCGETLDLVLRRAEEAERSASLANSNARSRSSTVVVAGGGSSGGSGMCMAIEALCGTFCGTFGIGHFLNGNFFLGLMFLLGYWVLEGINIALVFFGIGICTWPMCWIITLVMSLALISSTARSRGTIAVVHHDN